MYGYRVNAGQMFLMEDYDGPHCVLRTVIVEVTFICTRLCFGVDSVWSCASIEALALVHLTGEKPLVGFILHRNKDL